MAILSSVDPKENLERLDWALDRATGFVGVVDIIGNRTAAEAGPILARLRRARHDAGERHRSARQVRHRTADGGRCRVVVPTSRVASWMKSWRRSRTRPGTTATPSASPSSTPTLLRHLARVAGEPRAAIDRAGAGDRDDRRPAGHRHRGKMSGAAPDGYRRGVGIMLLHRDGRVFVGRRIDRDEEAWQMPQGGIDRARRRARRRVPRAQGRGRYRQGRVVAESAKDWLTYESAGALRRGCGAGAMRPETEMVRDAFSAAAMPTSISPRTIPNSTPGGGSRTTSSSR